MAYLLQHPLTTAFAGALLHSLWQFTVITGLAYSTTYVTKSAKQRHDIHLMAMLFCGVVFLATLLLCYEPLGDFVGENPGKWSDGLARSLLFSPEITVLVTPTTSLMAYLVPVYLVGLSLITSKTLVDLFRVRQLRKTLILPDAKLASTVEQILQQLSTTKSYQVRLSMAAKTAMTIGLFRPFIVLPIGLVNQLSVAETEAILLHEIAHLIRKDHIWNALQIFFQHLFFYHPCIHWLRSRMDAEREFACDDFVIARLDRTVYAQSLLQTARYSITPKNQFIMPAKGKSEFSTRLKRLFQTDHQRSRSPLLVALPLVLVAILGFNYPYFQANAADTFPANSTATELELADVIKVPAASEEITATSAVQQLSTPAAQMEAFARAYTKVDTVPPSKPKVKIAGPSVKNYIYFIDDEWVADLKQIDDRDFAMMIECPVSSDAKAMEIKAREGKDYDTVLRFYTSEDKIPAEHAIQQKAFKDKAQKSEKKSFKVTQKVINRDLFGDERTYENTIVIINGKRQYGNELPDLKKLTIQTIDIRKSSPEDAAIGFDHVIEIVTGEEKAAVRIKPAEDKAIVQIDGTAKVHTDVQEKVAIVAIRDSQPKEMAGKVVGIRVGEDKAKIRLRASKENRDDLLILLDGKQIPHDGFEDIDPDDIASVDVVKGAERIRELGYEGDYTGAVIIISKQALKKMKRGKKRKKQR